jgi:hypothetical protein
LEFFSQNGIVGSLNPIGVEFFGLEDDVGEPIDGSEVVPSYGTGFGATGEFDFDCS